MPVMTKPTPGAQGGGSNAGPLSTRRGTVIAAGLVALLAGLVLLFALQQYRSSVAGEGQAANVLVAKALIPKGSNGEVLPAEDLIEVTEVRADQLREKAFTDPARLRGMVAARDVLPGQQLTAADFMPSAGGAGARLGGKDRAVAIEAAGVKGVSGSVQTGDRVDVYVAFGTTDGGGSGGSQPVVKTLMQNVLVLRGAAVGENGEAAEGGDVVLKVAADFVPELTYSAENGVLWLALRPGAGANDPKKEIVGLQTVLLGDPIKLGGNSGEGDDE